MCYTSEAYILISATNRFLNIWYNQFLIKIDNYNPLRKNMTVAWIWDFMTLDEE